MAVYPLPPGLNKILLIWDVGLTNNSIYISATNLVNGIMPLPTMPGYTMGVFSYQLFGTNGAFGSQWVEWPAWEFYEELDDSGASSFSFVDGRQHLKENLKFL